MKIEIKKFKPIKKGFLNLGNAFIVLVNDEIVFDNTIKYNKNNLKKVKYKKFTDKKSIKNFNFLTSQEKEKINESIIHYIISLKNKIKEIK